MQNLRSSNKIAFQALHVDRFALETSQPLSLGGDELELPTFVNSSTRAIPAHQICLSIRHVSSLGDASYPAIRIDINKDQAKLQEKRGSQK